MLVSCIESASLDNSEVQNSDDDIGLKSTVTYINTKLSKKQCMNAVRAARLKLFDSSSDHFEHIIDESYSFNVGYLDIEVLCLDKNDVVVIMVANFSSSIEGSVEYVKHFRKHVGMKMMETGEIKSLENF